MKIKTLEQERPELDPWSLYIYAMKAPMTREKYKIRLAKFLDFIGLEVEDGNRSLEDKECSLKRACLISTGLSHIY